MEHANHKIWNPNEDRSSLDQSSSPKRAVARILIRRDVSRQALRQIEEFLRTSAVGGFIIGQAGSSRSGYWTTIEVRDRRDLDRLRQRYRVLIDGWQELG